MQDNQLQPALLPTPDEVEKHLSVLNAEKDKVTKLFVAASDNAKKYDAKFKAAKAEFSREYHQKKITKFKEESIRLLKFLTLIDNTINRTNEQLASSLAAAAQERTARAELTESKTDVGALAE